MSEKLLIQLRAIKKVAIRIFDVFFLSVRLNFHIKKTELMSIRCPQNSKHRRICLFSSWDPNGKVHDYVFHYLKSISALGFDIYFCTTGDKDISTYDLLKLKQICSHISHRQNLGLDFVSWKLCYLRIPFFKKYDKILLANDSVFGPFFPLNDLINKADKLEASVISMTDSFEITYHLQSYFLYFKDKASLKILSKFFSEIHLLKDKKLIIENYEIGLSTRLLSGGVSLEALFPFKKMAENAQFEIQNSPFLERFKTGPINPSIYLWKILLEKFDFPFLKRELLIKKVDVTNCIGTWEAVLSKFDRVAVDYIREYLSRCGKI